MSINPSTVKYATDASLQTFGALFTLTYSKNFTKVGEKRAILALYLLSHMPELQGKGIPSDWQPIFMTLDQDTFEDIKKEYSSFWEKISDASKNSTPKASLKRGGIEEDNDSDGDKGEESDKLMTEANPEHESDNTPNQTTYSASDLQIDVMYEKEEPVYSPVIDASFYSCSKGSNEASTSEGKSSQITMELQKMRNGDEQHGKAVEGVGDPFFRDLLQSNSAIMEQQTELMKTLVMNNRAPPPVTIAKQRNENIANPRVWHRKYLFYNTLYVRRAGAEMTIKELFDEVMAHAESAQDFSWTSWNLCFQTIIGKETKELHKGLKPKGHVDVIREYQDKHGLEDADLNLIFILLAYLHQTAMRDTENGNSIYTNHEKTFSRTDIEPWEDWISRIERLLANTSYAELPYQHLIDICEEDIYLYTQQKKNMQKIEMQWFKKIELAEKALAELKRFRKIREKKLKTIFMKNGEVQAFINLNVEKARLNQHPQQIFTISQRYINKLFDHMVENINWGSGDQNKLAKWMAIHYERMTYRTPECSPATSEEALDNLVMCDEDYPRLTLRESARILDTIYYMEKPRYRNTEQYKNLSHELILTEDDKRAYSNEKKETNKGQRSTTEINNFNVSKGKGKKAFTKRESPIPQKYTDILFKYFPKYSEIPKTCKYEGCKVPKERAKHWSHNCYTLWKNEPERAADLMDEKLEEYKTHQNLERLQKSLATTVRTEEQLHDDDDATRQDESDEKSESL